MAILPSPLGDAAGAPPSRTQPGRDASTATLGPATVLAASGIGLTLIATFLPLDRFGSQIVQFDVSGYAWWTQGVLWVARFYGLLTMAIIATVLFIRNAAWRALAAGFLAGVGSSLVMYAMAVLAATIARPGDHPGIGLLPLGLGGTAVLAAGIIIRPVPPGLSQRSPQRVPRMCVVAAVVVAAGAVGATVGGVAIRLDPVVHFHSARYLGAASVFLVSGLLLRRRPASALLAGVLLGVGADLALAVPPEFLSPLLVPPAELEVALPGTVLAAGAGVAIAAGVSLARATGPTGEVPPEIL